MRRITKCSKTGQWLGETCVPGLRTPQVQAPPASSTGDQVEEGDVLAALFNDNGTCEIVAPASRSSSRYDTTKVIPSARRRCWQ